MATTQTTSPFPSLDSAPMTSEPDASVLTTPSDAEFQLEYEGPLYTEINIPLPRIPTSYQQPSNTSSTDSKTSSSSSEDRPRSRTLTLSRFRQRSSSSSSATSSTSSTTPTRHSADSPRPRKSTVRSREVNAMMDLRHQGKKSGRNGVIDALAVVPAVLVLSAELFTPGDEGAKVQGNGRRKDSGVGRWEDGIR